MTNHVLDEEGHCHPPQQNDSRSLPKTPPNTPAILWCGWGLPRLHTFSAHSNPQISILRLGHTVQFSIVLAPSGYPIVVKLYATVHSVLKSNTHVSCCLILCSFHLSPASINYFMDQLKFYIILRCCSFHSCSNGTGNGR